MYYDAASEIDGRTTSISTPAQWGDASSCIYYVTINWSGDNVGLPPSRAFEFGINAAIGSSCAAVRGPERATGFGRTGQAAQDGRMKLRALRRISGQFAALSPRRRLLVGASLLVVAALVVAGVLRATHGDATAPVDPGTSQAVPPQPGASSTGAAQPGGGQPATVVLVPGYGGNTGSLRTLAARIRATGDTTMIVALPSGGTGDLEAQADVLNGYVNQALRGGAGSVDVVGYSAGGVVARLWDVEHDGASKVRRIITLGSPLHGAQLAAVGAAVDPAACPTACQQLVPGSALLTRLDRIPLTGRPAWLSLWTLNDQTVRPPDSARLAGAVNVPLQSVCPGAVIQHGQLPSNPLVIGIVLRAITAAPLTAPTAADCASLRALGRAD